MGRFGLKEADITRLALCKVGANRQRVFLLKSGDGDDREHHAFARLIKEPGADWRVAYVPVAVPDVEEDQGIFATGQGDTDVWESPGEIAKAAHSFMRNGQQIVSQHFDNAQAAGVRLVESAVALNDFAVGDTQIAKGTWYVGLEFDAEAKQLVDSGEIDAVSVEGFATRVAKVETFSKPGTADVTASDAAKIEPLARHYLSMPHPFTACVRDQLKHGLPQDHANRRCAVLLDKFDPQRLRHSVAKEPGDWTQEDIDALVLQADSGTVEGMGEEIEVGFASTAEVREPSRFGRLLDRIAKGLGVPPEEWVHDCGVEGCNGACNEFAVDPDADVWPEGQDELAKATLDAKARKKLPKTAFAIPEKAPGPGSYPIHDRGHAAAAVSRAKGKPVESRVHGAVCARHPTLPFCLKRKSKMAKEDERVSEETDGTVEGVEVGERIDKIEERISGLETKLIGTEEEPGAIAKIASAVEKLTEKPDPEKPEPEKVAKETRDDLEKKIDAVAEEFAGKIEPLAKAINELEEGDSAQPETNGQPVAKESTNDLEGILF